MRVSSSAREAREVSGREVFDRGSIGAAGRSAGVFRRNEARSSPSRPTCWTGRGVRPVHDRDLLDEARGSSRPATRPCAVFVSADRRDRPSTREPRPAGVTERCCQCCCRSSRRRSGAERWRWARRGAVVALEAMGGDEWLRCSVRQRRAAQPERRPYDSTARRRLRLSAEFAADVPRLGARRIRLLCTTRPLEDAEIASAVEEEREPSVLLDVLERELLVAAARQRGRRRRSAADAAERASWVTCVELMIRAAPTTRTPSVSRMLKVLREGLSFVDINDNPMARRRANVLMGAVAIERDRELETIRTSDRATRRSWGSASSPSGAHAAGVWMLPRSRRLGQIGGTTRSCVYG